MSYQHINELQKKALAPVPTCRVLVVSRSGYHAARGRWQRPKKIAREAVQVQAAFAASGKSYDSRRLVVCLQNEGIKASRYWVRKIMKFYQLHPVWKRKFSHTTQSNRAFPCAENLLNRQINPPNANQAWVSDLTYIRTRRGWRYLAAVLDLIPEK